MQPRNAELREKIAELEKQLVGMSHGSVERPRIIEDIKALALQLEPEHHWSVVPLFWVSVVAMIAACIAAYPIASAWLQPSTQADQSASGNSASQSQSAPAKEQSQSKLQR